MSATFSIPVVSFRNLESPFKNLGYKNYVAVVNVNALPDELRNWGDRNVRFPKTKGIIPGKIRTGFRQNPDLFLFMNRGIVISVEKAYFNQAESRVDLVLSSPLLHGLIDGGHTFKIIQEERKPDVDQYVKLEILEGFSLDELIDVIDARNTSTQVREEDLMNLQQDFAPLQEALEGARFKGNIAYRSNEPEDLNSTKIKEIDVKDIIALLTVFDRDNYDDNTHPIIAYSSKGACRAHFKEHMDSYKKIYPLAQDILELYDHIQEELPDLYQKERRNSDEVSRGAFGRLTGVSHREDKNINQLFFLQRKSKYSIPDGYVLPILGGFRAFLEEKDGHYIWGMGLVPNEMLKGDLGLKLAGAIGRIARETANPNKSGKSASTWYACYSACKMAYDAHKIARLEAREEI